MLYLCSFARDKEARMRTAQVFCLVFLGLLVWSLIDVSAILTQDGYPANLWAFLAVFREPLICLTAMIYAIFRECCYRDKLNANKHELLSLNNQIRMHEQGSQQQVVSSRKPRLRLVRPDHDD